MRYAAKIKTANLPYLTLPPPTEVYKKKKLDDLLLRFCNAVYNQNTIDRWTKIWILRFPKR